MEDIKEDNDDEYVLKLIDIGCASNVLVPNGGYTS